MARKPSLDNPEIHFKADPPELKAQAAARFQKGQTFQTVLNTLLAQYAAGKIIIKPAGARIIEESATKPRKVNKGK